MSKMKFDDFCALKKDKFDWKIKVRILRLWRGISRTGEVFKGFNVLLLDSKVKVTVPNFYIIPVYPLS